MTTLYVQLSFDVIGEDASKVANAMRASIADGEMDYPLMQILRDEFDAIEGDWRIVRLDTTINEGAKVTP
jgi:hypothetical protein